MGHIVTVTYISNGKRIKDEGRMQGTKQEIESILNECNNVLEYEIKN